MRDTTKPMVFILFLMFLPELPTPTASSAYQIRHLQPRSQYRGFGPGLDCKYEIQPFLKVASDLQSLDEQARVDRLAELAGIHSLNEPTIMLIRLLIENRDGTPLRRPMLGAPAFYLPDLPELESNEPFFFFEGVPFVSVSGYTVNGLTEPAYGYLAYALKVGRWRDVKYETIPEAKLKAIAQRFLKTCQRVESNKYSARWINSQVGKPSRKKHGVPK